MRNIFVLFLQLWFNVVNVGNFRIALKPVEIDSQRFGKSLVVSNCPGKAASLKGLSNNDKIVLMQVMAMALMMLVLAKMMMMMLISVVMVFICRQSEPARPRACHSLRTAFALCPLIIIHCTLHKCSMHSLYIASTLHLNAISLPCNLCNLAHLHCFCTECNFTALGNSMKCKSGNFWTNIMSALELHSIKNISMK